jgi:hypothetical protein
MWILKNSKQVLENSKSQGFSKIDSIKTYEFSTLHTTIPHKKSKIYVCPFDTTRWTRNKGHHLIYRLYIWIFYLILTQMADWQLHYMTNIMILTLQSSIFLFYVVIYHFRLLIRAETNIRIFANEYTNGYLAFEYSVMCRDSREYLYEVMQPITLPRWRNETGHL